LREFYNGRKKRKKRALAERGIPCDSAKLGN
jgi:hypothetical protein